MLCCAWLMCSEVVGGTINEYQRAESADYVDAESILFPVCRKHVTYSMSCSILALTLWAAILRTAWVRFCADVRNSRGSTCRCCLAFFSYCELRLQIATRIVIVLLECVHTTLRRMAPATFSVPLWNSVTHLSIVHS